MTTIPHPTMGHPVEKIGDVFTYQEKGQLVGGLAFEWNGKKYGIEWSPREERFMILSAGFALRTLEVSVPIPKAIP